jgi:VIT1/CCC1 family predicted Fe2+/Mn2+ transporter
MKAINDRIRAKRLLAAREHKFRVIPFLRHNALSYAAYAVLIAVILMVLAFYGLWSAFGFVVSFVLGMLVVYIRWLRAQRSVWPFAMRIINWESVQKLSEDAPSA